MNISIKSGYHLYSFMILTRDRKLKSILVQAMSATYAQLTVTELYPGSRIVSNTIIDEIYSC